MRWLFESKFNTWDLIGCLAAFTKVQEGLANALWVLPALFIWLLVSRLMQKELGM